MFNLPPANGKSSDLFESFSREVRESGHQHINLLQAAFTPLEMFTEQEYRFRLIGKKSSTTLLCRRISENELELTHTSRQNERGRRQVNFRTKVTVEVDETLNKWTVKQIEHSSGARPNFQPVNDGREAVNLLAQMAKTAEKGNLEAPPTSKLPGQF